MPPDGALKRAMKPLNTIFPSNIKVTLRYALASIYNPDNCFNSYRVAQIKHIGATKPANWRPWEPKNKTKCRRFDAKD